MYKYSVEDTRYKHETKASSTRYHDDSTNYQDSGELRVMTLKKPVKNIVISTPKGHEDEEQLVATSRFCFTLL